jgi:hypothetical protein
VPFGIACLKPVVDPALLGTGIARQYPPSQYVIDRVGDIENIQKSIAIVVGSRDMWAQWVLFRIAGSEEGLIDHHRDVQNIDLSILISVAVA